MANDTKKYVKKLKLGTGDPLWVDDAEAIKTINGYTKEQLEGKEFANQAITDAEIDAMFTSAIEEIK